MNFFELKYIRVLLGKTLFIALPILFSSCTDFVNVDEVQDNMLAELVFESEPTANSAILGVYRNMRSAVQTPLIALNSIYSNEIMPYSNALSNSYYTFNLQPGDSTLPWNTFYAVIYASNNAIEQLERNTTIPETSKRRLIAEAKFVRALSHFYMVNLYGDIPLVLTTNLKINNKIPRTALTTVYSQMVTDLKDAKADLPDDYSHVAGGERVRANKWVVSALLARIYLYQKDYINASIEANAVIDSDKYSLLPSAAGIFNKNNNEAIFQFANNSTDNNFPVTSFIYSSAPTYICTPVLLNMFEAGDLRKSTWIRTTTYNGQSVSVPYKFTSTAANPPEYNTIIRLAEVYLIRAETRAMEDDFQGCAEDINLVRLRHGGLSAPLADPTNREEALDIILHERQVELFTECGHRFFDLKRTGRIDAVMQAEKPDFWRSTAALYPLPLTERQRNPNLTPQNPGYE